MSAIKKSFKYGDHTVTIETGELARQADGAVLVTMSETVVLVTAVGLKKATPGRDFFPLTVNYIEKTYAAGRIPGGFFKREGRPTEKETLTSRLIDRPIRPLFPEGFINDVQVVAQVISVNSEVDPDIASLLGASAALAISGMPFLGPIGGARVGYIDGKYILNPTTTQLATSQLDLVVAGTAEGVLMVESEAAGLNEEVMLGAVTFGHEQMQIAIKAINELAAEAGKPKWSWVAPEPNKELQSAVSGFAETAVAAAYTLTEKMAALRQDQGDQGRSGRSVEQGRDAEIYRRSSGRRVFQSGISTGARQNSRWSAAHRRPRHQDGARHQYPHRRARANSRFCVVHPRRDPGSGRDDVGNRARCADHRRPDGRDAKSRSCCTTISLLSASARPA